MEIKHLTYFQKALINWNELYDNNKLSYYGLSLPQIEVLEGIIYQNASQKFPTVLREMLWLVGKRCPFFDAGVWIRNRNKETLDEKDLLYQQSKNPYFEMVESYGEIDHFFKDRLIWTLFTVYESSEEFMFVYLDEEDDDPFVYFFDTIEYNNEGSRDGSVNLISDDIGSYFQLERRRVRLSKLIYVEYKSFCMDVYQGMRPPYNENISLLYEKAALNEDTKQNDFYSLISKRDLSGVKYFIEQGIDVTANNNQAIIETAKTDDQEIFDLLIEAGADPLDQNEKILEVGAKKGSPNLIQYLLEKNKFSKNTIDRALVYSCAIGQNRSIEYLLENGADVNAFNSLGVQLAVRNRHYLTARILVAEHGANNKVNFGFIKLFENELEPSYTKEVLTSDIKFLKPIETIIEKHESDLKHFYGDVYKKENFQDFPADLKNRKDSKWELFLSRFK